MEMGVVKRNKILLYFAVLGFSAVLLSTIAGFSAPVLAQYQDANLNMEKEQNAKFDSAFAQALSVSLNSGKIYRQALRDNKALSAFYQARNYDPYWVKGESLNNNAQKFIQAIADSWTHGLNPYDYHYQEISELSLNPSALDVKTLEVLLSDAFVRYAYDMTGLRVDPDLFKLDAKDWKVNVSASQALSDLNGSRDIDHLLAKIEPQGRTYKALRREFIKLVQERAELDGEQVHVDFGGLMKPGWDHKAVLDLRKRLDVQIPERNKYVYDDELAAAVIKFQKENNLNADGVLGTNTLAVLNRTHKDKINQLIANMERLRWAKPNTSRRFVIVNIPSYTLWAVENGKVALEMPVIVGSPWRRTRSFATEIKGMRFNPDWTVPPTVKRYDIWPKVQEDPEYLTNKGIELYDGYGRNARTIDPKSVDWDNLSLKELHAIRMVQIPGDHNALGRYRVLMPNPYNMYLHDTNHPEVFEQTELAASSGCMRLKYPEKMAEFVMKGTAGWSNDDMRSTLDSMEVTDVSIDEPIPVQVTYYTAWLDDKGQVVYGHDIYGYDKKLVEELRKLDGYRIPVHHKESDMQFVPKAQTISFSK